MPDSSQVPDRSPASDSSQVPDSVSSQVPAFIEALALRWDRDVRSGAATTPGPGAASAGIELIARWQEPHRRYHTLTHLVAVLDGVDELAAQADDAATVRLAAWFHDAVYEARPGADEEASARLAEQVLPGLGWPAHRVAEVARLVRLTADHAAIGGDDRNAAVLADADLAVLAFDERRYRAYARAVREEYAHVPDDQFAAGRTDVLTRLLSSPLYRTPAARDRWTAAAEANLSAEIARLAR
jgi:predicted metal-dependent HD superfamily phosphohydrolase